MKYMISEKYIHQWGGVKCGGVNWVFVVYDNMFYAQCRVQSEHRGRNKYQECRTQEMSMFGIEPLHIFNQN